MVPVPAELASKWNQSTMVFVFSLGERRRRANTFLPSGLIQVAMENEVII